VKEDLFDSKIRAMLENGEEEVPAGLWDAIEGRLPSTKRPAIVWLRRSAVIMAAAASVAIALLLPSRKDSSLIDIVTPPVQQAIVAQQLNDLVEEDIVDGNAIPDNVRPQSVTNIRTDSPVVPAEEAIPEEVPAREETPEDNTVTDITPDSKPSASKQENIWSNSASFPDDDIFRQKSSGVTMTASYNATSNNNPTSASANGAARSYSHGSVDNASEGIVETGSSRYAIPVSFGLGIRIPFSEKWALGTGLNFSILNRSFAGKYTTEDGSTYTYSDIRNNLLYLGIPINVYYSFTQLKMIDLYAYAGGTVEKCIGNSYHMSGVGGNFSFKEATKGVQASVNAGIGVEFLAFKNLGFYFDPSLRYYFNCNQPVSIRTQQPLMMGFEVGLRFKLQ